MDSLIEESWHDALSAGAGAALRSFASPLVNYSAGRLNRWPACEKPFAATTAHSSGAPNAAGARYFRQVCRAPVP